MKTFFTILIALFCSVIVPLYAQKQTSFSFERLFNLKEGISKETVQDSLSGFSGIIPANSFIHVSSDKAAKPEILIYNTSTLNCVKGRNGRIQFEFINNRLYKAFIHTEYTRADHYEMIDNFNSLRTAMRTFWEGEKAVKVSSGSLVSNGYDYNRLKQTKPRSGKASLQYIATTADKGFGIYLLELTWINTGNTGLEAISY